MAGGMTMDVWKVPEMIETAGRGHNNNNEGKRETVGKGNYDK
jgi:hypothetical protein